MRSNRTQKTTNVDYKFNIDSRLFWLIVGPGWRNINKFRNKVQFELDSYVNVQGNSSQERGAPEALLISGKKKAVERMVELLKKHLASLPRASVIFAKWMTGRVIGPKGRNIKGFQRQVENKCGQRVYTKIVSKDNRSKMDVIAATPQAVKMMCNVVDNFLMQNGCVSSVSCPTARRQSQRQKVNVPINISTKSYQTSKAWKANTYAGATKNLSQATASKEDFPALPQAKKVVRKQPMAVIRTALIPKARAQVIRKKLDEEAKKKQEATNGGQQSSPWVDVDKFTSEAELWGNASTASSVGGWETASWECDASSIVTVQNNARSSRARSRSSTIDSSSDNLSVSSYSSNGRQNWADIPPVPQPVPVRQAKKTVQKKKMPLSNSFAALTMEEPKLSKW